ncbi:hypothetical protein BU24DRAFT_416297 [Aaosphaeria arxii CBS 175.79]|uniref:Serine/threonine-protein kinase ppk6 n=1 Tax=Aaosphaeria arxii CBS 175.79 TaxID=1450172 RepID=A0A6A5Y5R2_9PLEO|nr:uncharacterized protein BU24DRAFT_416297 [Aaosphaeria arxii CBS 175.79]KAF2020626.1 hypothetical protein BU24DRAFT_416297 [Aaosphaeria arxii CBS 175.79]
MSADLFAEFGDFGAAPAQQQQQQQSQSSHQPPKPVAPQAAPSFSFFDDLAGPTSTPQAAPARQQSQPQDPFNQTWGTQPAKTDDNDDWGDFEGESSSQPALPASSSTAQGTFGTAPSTQSSSQSQLNWQTKPPNQISAFDAPSTQKAQSHQTSSLNWQSTPTSNFHDAFSSQPIRQSQEQSQFNWQPAPVIKAKKSADPSVLFDAEDDFDDDDDFGDFEGDDAVPTPSATPAPAPAPAPRSTGMEDLLGDLTVSEPQTKPQPRAPAKKTTKNQVGAFGTTARAKEPKSPVKPAQPEPKEEDSWDAFDDWEATIPTKKPAAKAAPEPKKAATPTPKEPASSLISSDLNEAQPGELPPTNVPPPAVLLSLFPPLFAEAQDKLFKPMAAQPIPMRNKLVSDPSTITYLQSFLLVASVAARIISARKLRWKRDAHLSQGMRIGPASSRATSGMKLTGIDRSEAMKEDREVADVVRAWKEQVGRLRHVVSAANQARPGSLGAVPDLQETMPVRTLKQSEGGVPAPRPCMLCGMRREERGSGDLGVEDSFGEWWVEQVSMHRGCRNFWNQHKDMLRQR